MKLPQFAIIIRAHSFRKIATLDSIFSVLRRRCTDPLCAVMTLHGSRWYLICVQSLQPLVIQASSLSSPDERGTTRYATRVA